jgi:hypothetical protein
VAGDQRIERADRVHVVARIGKVGTVAAIEATTVDEQRLVSVTECRPSDLVLVEVKLGNSIGEPVEVGGGRCRNGSRLTV